VIDFVHGGRTYKVKLPLVGAFQVQNAALAAGLAIATGAEPIRTFAALEHLTGAKGRLELVGNRNGAPIFIDYAHKPDALKKALGSLRPYAKRKLTVVFGAGGDRDSGKRPIMGRVAVEGADKVIVTDDNPRSENPAAIRAAILTDAPGAAEIAPKRSARQSQISEWHVPLIAGKAGDGTDVVTAFCRFRIRRWRPYRAGSHERVFNRRVSDAMRRARRKLPAGISGIPSTVAR
jgi:UDP-N-acetylmuramoyl-L-alanyl-D-glutamate--2,6-diaminopimelate ligase